MKYESAGAHLPLREETRTITDAVVECSTRMCDREAASALVVERLAARCQAHLDASAAESSCRTRFD